MTPTLLTDLEAAGYDRSFEAVDPDAAPAYPPPPVARRPWWAVQCRARRHAVWLPPGVRLDLGGVAKGWAADLAAHRLARWRPALVEAGGDVAVSAPRVDGSPWPIGVEHPIAESVDLSLIQLSAGGVATSSIGYRRWQRHGRWQHHLIDPRTGQPASTDVLSATVIDPSACEADMGAKVALLLGSRDGLAWLEAHPPFAGLLLLDDDLMVRSRR